MRDLVRAQTRVDIHEQGSGSHIQHSEQRRVDQRRLGEARHFDDLHVPDRRRAALSPACKRERRWPAASTPGWTTVRQIAEALGITLKELAEAVEAEDSEGA
jgi:hypothetical protein